MAYGDFKDLAKRAASDKVLKSKTLKASKLEAIQNMMDIKESCFYGL